MNALKWDARPKPDSSRRRTIIMDLEAITVASFTSDLWALEPGKPELVEEAFHFYEPYAGVVLAHVLAHWCTPNLIRSGLDSPPGSLGQPSALYDSPVGLNGSFPTPDFTYSPDVVE